MRIAQGEGLSVNNVLESARKNDSPLHDFFEWDNSKAAEKWRRQQARFLINIIEIQIGEKLVPAFENISVDIDEVKKRIYIPTYEILQNQDYKNQVALMALREIKHWQEKYNMFSEFKPIYRAIKKVESKMKK